jgi:hypothetical protein
LPNVSQLRYGGQREAIRNGVGDEITGKCKPLWGLDEEKEIRGVWRDLDIPHLWAMMGIIFCMTRSNNKLNGLLGNLTQGRFHSKHVALRKWR